MVPPQFVKKRNDSRGKCLSETNFYWMQFSNRIYCVSFFNQIYLYLPQEFSFTALLSEKVSVFWEMQIKLKISKPNFKRNTSCSNFLANIFLTVMLLLQREKREKN